MELLRERGALLVGHHPEVDVDVGDAGEGRDRVGDEADDLGPHAGSPATVRAMVTLTVPPSICDAAHHVQLDDRAVDLGVLDRAQGFEHLGLGGHAGHS